MTYKKPEVNLLGDAAQLVQGVKFSGEFDVLDPNTPITAAYDLDE